MVFVSSCKTSLEKTKNLSKTTSLFNGKDLSGWTIYGTEKWYVEAGQLVCENGPDNSFGYLITDKHYKNFELTLDFKQEKNGNSGIFVHSTIDGSKIKGFQIEIAPPGHSAGGINYYDRGWLVKPDPEKDKNIKMKEWNQMKIRLENNKLTSWLNGSQMATIIDKKIGDSKGSIALQVHGANVTKIRWRNLQVIEL